MLSLAGNLSTSILDIIVNRCLLPSLTSSPPHLQDPPRPYSELHC